MHYVMGLYFLYCPHKLFKMAVISSKSILFLRYCTLLIMYTKLAEYFPRSRLYAMLIDRLDCRQSDVCT